MLKLYKYGHYQNSLSNYNAPVAYKIHQITKKWAETGANWTKATSSMNWSKAGGDFNPAVIDSFKWDGNLDKDWFYWDVTKAIVSMVKDPETNFGFLILLTDPSPGSEDESANNDSYFYSSEAANGSLTPRLIVTGSPGTATAVPYAARRSFRIRCSHSDVSVYLPNRTPYFVTVSDNMGRTLFRNGLKGNADWTRVPCDFSPGLYYITVQSEGVPETHGTIVY